VWGGLRLLGNTYEIASRDNGISSRLAWGKPPAKKDALSLKVLRSRADRWLSKDYEFTSRDIGILRRVARAKPCVKNDPVFPLAYAGVKVAQRPVGV
jgi:hypothetical protein